MAATRSKQFKATLQMARTVGAIVEPTSDADVDLDASRRAVARLCRMLGEELRQRPATPDTSNLSRRMRQTLDRLLTGDSEKQIALHLKLSPHTVHVYVKSLHKHFDVSSRGELLALFVRRPTLGRD